MGDKLTRKTNSSLMLLIFWHDLTLLFQWSVTANQYCFSSDLSLMKHLFKDDSTPSNSAQQHTEWFDEDKNYVNSYAMAFIVIGSQPNWRPMDAPRMTCYTGLCTTIIKTSAEGISFGKMVFLHPVSICETFRMCRIRSCSFGFKTPSYVDFSFNWSIKLVFILKICHLFLNSN